MCVCVSHGHMKADVHMSYMYYRSHTFSSKIIIRQSMAIELLSARSSAAATNAMRRARPPSPSSGQRHKRRTPQPLRPLINSMTRTRSRCLRCLDSYVPMRASRRNGSKRKLVRSFMSSRTNIKRYQKNVRFTNTLIRYINSATVMIRRNADRTRNGVAQKRTCNSSFDRFTDIRNNKKMN